MARRKIVQVGDPILRKVCKPVENFDSKLGELIDDMIETLHHAEGLGLAAPQVGILRRVCIVEYDDELYELVNPKLVKSKGKCILLVGFRMEEDRKVLPYLPEAALQHHLRRCPGHDKVPVVHRESEQSVPYGPANEISFH